MTDRTQNEIIDTAAHSNADLSSGDISNTDTSSTHTPNPATLNEPSNVMPGASFLSSEDRARITQLTSSNDARFKSDAQNQAVLERANEIAVIAKVV